MFSLLLAGADDFAIPPETAISQSDQGLDHLVPPTNRMLEMAGSGSMGPSIIPAKRNEEEVEFVSTNPIKKRRMSTSFPPDATGCQAPQQPTFAFNLSPNSCLPEPDAVEPRLTGPALGLPGAGHELTVPPITPDPSLTAMDGYVFPTGFPSSSVVGQNSSPVLSPRQLSSTISPNLLQKNHSQALTSDQITPGQFQDAYTSQIAAESCDSTMAPPELTVETVTESDQRCNGTAMEKQTDEANQVTPVLMNSIRPAPVPMSKPKSDWQPPKCWPGLRPNPNSRSGNLAKRPSPPVAQNELGSPKSENIQWRENKPEPSGSSVRPQPDRAASPNGSQQENLSHVPATSPMPNLQQSRGTPSPTPAGPAPKSSQSPGTSLTRSQTPMSSPVAGEHGASNGQCKICAAAALRKRAAFNVMNATSAPFGPGSVPTALPVGGQPQNPTGLNFFLVPGLVPQAAGAPTQFIQQAGPSSCSPSQPTVITLPGGQQYVVNSPSQGVMMAKMPPTQSHQTGTINDPPNKINKSHTGQAVSEAQKQEAAKRPTQPESRAKKHLIVDIADTCLEIFPFEEVAKRHMVSGAKVKEIFEAIVQVPLLRFPLDKRRAGALGTERVKEYGLAKKKMASSGKQGHGARLESDSPGPYSVARFMGATDGSDQIAPRFKGPR